MTQAKNRRLNAAIDSFGARTGLRATVTNCVASPYQTVATTNAAAPA